MFEYCKDCLHWKADLIAEDRNWRSYLFCHECDLELSPTWNEEEECMECERFVLYRED